MRLDSEENLGFDSLKLCAGPQSEDIRSLSLIVSGSFNCVRLAFVAFVELIRSILFLLLLTCLLLSEDKMK